MIRKTCISLLAISLLVSCKKEDFKLKQESPDASILTTPLTIRKTIGIIHQTPGSNRQYFSFVDKSNGNQVNGGQDFHTTLYFNNGIPSTYANLGDRRNTYLNAVAYGDNGKVIFSHHKGGYDNAIQIMVDNLSQEGALLQATTNTFITTDPTELPSVPTNFIGSVLPRNNKIVDLEFYESQPMVYLGLTTDPAIGKVIDGINYSKDLIGIQLFGNSAKLIRINIPELNNNPNNYYPKILFDFSTLPNGGISGPYKLDIVDNTIYVADASNNSIHKFKINSNGTVTYQQTYGSMSVSNYQQNFSFFIDNNSARYNFTNNGDNRWDLINFIGSGTISGNGGSRRYTDLSEGFYITPELVGLN
jgi:hypothetical protein